MTPNMFRRSISLCAIALASLFSVGTMAQQAPPASQDVSITGCVIQGFSPMTFTLENAKFDPNDPEERSKDYVLVSASPELDLNKFLNHRVQAFGVLQPSGEPTPASKLTTHKVTSLASSCLAQDDRR